MMLTFYQMAKSVVSINELTNNSNAQIHTKINATQIKKCGRFVLFMPFLLVVRIEYHTFALVL